ncbi:MAG: hypothetical protein HY774_06800 [Acidobacteria bacterium]|nr:hypothetical protein [Acidobacteriota bacterium]
MNHPPQTIMLGDVEFLNGSIIVLNACDNGYVRVVGPDDKRVLKSGANTIDENSCLFQLWIIDSNTIVLQDCALGHYVSPAVDDWKLTSLLNEIDKWCYFTPENGENGSIALKSVVVGKYVSVIGVDDLYATKDSPEKPWCFFVPTLQEKLSFTFTDIVYANNPDPKQDGATPLDIIATNVIKNPTQVEIQSIQTASLSKQCTFQWSLTQTLAIGTTVGFSAEAPGFGGVNAEVTASLTLEKNQSYTVTETKEYSFSETFIIPANTGVKIHVYTDWDDNVDVPFTLKVRVQGTSGKVTLNRNQIIKLLRDQGFDGKIVDDEAPDPDPTSCLAAIEGVFRGAYGVKKTIETSNVPLDSLT